MKKTDLVKMVADYMILIRGKARDYYAQCPRNYATQEIESHDDPEWVSTPTAPCGYEFCEICGMAKDFENIISTVEAGYEGPYYG